MIENSKSGPRIHTTTLEICIVEEGLLILRFKGRKMFEYSDVFVRNEK